MLHLVDAVNHRELRCGLFLTGKPVGIMIRANHPLALANGRDVETLSLLQMYLPSVFGHTRDDILAGKGPFRAHATILYP